MAKITEGVYKIKGDGNVYVILGGKNIVIDTGDLINSLTIKSEIEKIVVLDKVDIVLLTHLHYDHAGNVDLFPNAEFYASVEEIENYRERPEESFFSGISKKSDIILRERLKPLSDSIIGLEVIRVPGHTRGSVAFLDRERGLLFSGDTIFGDRIGRTDLPNSVPDEMAESVERLIGLVEDGELVLCPGHDY